MNKMREEMAAAFLAALKEDEIPWRRGWTVNNVQNAITGKEYNGINRLWLSYVSEVNKYDDPRWCTYKQAADKGWQVKKGEKGTRVEFWSLYDTEKKKKLSYRESKKLLDEIGKEEYDKRVKPISNIYSVFNGEQIEGIPEYELNTYTVVNPDEILLYRDKLLTNMNLGFNERGESAFYRKSEDAVTMPVMEKFDNNYAYMSVFLHECGHATGHKSRLSRDLSGTFGSEKYAKEELRAEISSAFTTAELGINPGEETEHMKNHKAYVQNWISVLENDPNELFRAIKDAEKISDYLIEKGEFKLKKEEQEISATYKLYQMNEGEKYHGRHFEPLEYNKKHGNLTMDDYHFVYGGNFDEVEGNTTIDKLNSLYSSFNGETKPEGYTGYSMSTSDVVVITDAKAGTETAFYCDRYGFQEYPDFLQKEEVKQQEPELPDKLFNKATGNITIDAFDNVDSETMAYYGKKLNYFVDMSSQTTKTYTLDIRNEDNFELISRSSFKNLDDLLETVNEYEKKEVVSERTVSAEAEKESFAKKLGYGSYNDMKSLIPEVEEFFNNEEYSEKREEELQLLNAAITSELPKEVERDFAFAEKKLQNESEDNVFKKQLDKYFSGSMKSHEIINVCSTPNILKLMGSEARKVVINQNELENSISLSTARNKNHTNGHEIDKNEIYKLSEAIRTPIMVLKGNRKNENSVILLTELVNNKDEKVFVPISLDRQKGKINNISTLYGKKNLNDYLKRNLSDILAINIKKADTLADTENQFLQSINDTVVRFDDSIAYTMDNIKTKIKKITNSEVNSMDIYTNKEDTQTQPEQNNIDEGFFEYQGYHFKPVGVYPDDTSYLQVIAETSSNEEPFMSNYEDAKIPYDYMEFYKASGAPNADIFLCVETGNVYIPGNNELFLYKGEYNPYVAQVKSEQPEVENNIRHTAPDGVMYYDSREIEKEIPENMRFKEANTSLEQDGGIYWVTQEMFSYADLEAFQAAMIKFDITKAYVTVRDLSPSYSYEYDKVNSPLVEITQEEIKYKEFNSRCEGQGDSYFCVYPKNPKKTEEIKEVQDMDIKELPDSTINISDMQNYGYTWDGMLPLNLDAAINLYEKSEIFRLYPDGSEGAVIDIDDMKAHAEYGGIFGIEKDSWNIIKSKLAENENISIPETQPENIITYGILKNPDMPGLMEDAYMVVEHTKSNEHKTYDPLEHIIYKGSQKECNEIKDKLTNKEITVDAVKELSQAAENKAKEEKLIDKFKTFEKEHKEAVKAAGAERTTIIINAFAGPGAGKTVACMDICAELKKAGYNAEYVQEYAKELVYEENMEMLNGSLESQWKIFKEQVSRVDRLIGKTDFIVTDSPALLSPVYLSDKDSQAARVFEMTAGKVHDHYKNFSFFLNRDASSFQEEGRIHNLAESKEKDKEIKGTLKRNNVFCCNYSRDSVDKIAKNAETTFKRMSEKQKKQLLKKKRYVLY